MTSALIVIFESPVYLFYLDPVAYRVRIDVRQLVVFPLPIGCLFQTVVLSSLACLRPTASHRCPSWSPWVAENHVGSCALSHKSCHEGLAILVVTQALAQNFILANCGTRLAGT
jgi:hypothetical protein